MRKCFSHNAREAIFNSDGKLVRFIDHLMQHGIWIKFDAITLLSVAVICVILSLSYYAIPVKIKHTKTKKAFYLNKTNKMYNTNTMQLT